MAENFMHYHGGPTPILPKGSQQFGKKTTTTTPSHKTQPGHPHVKQRPSGHKGNATEHDPKSPPVTPHRTTMSAGLMSPVSQYGPLRGNPSPAIGYLRHRTMQAEPVLPKGSQEWGKTASGAKGGQGKQPGHVSDAHRQPGGGQKTRPYGGTGEGGPASVDAKSTSQKHDRSGAIAPRMHVGMTKKIRGLIGKKPSHQHRNPY